MAHSPELQRFYGSRQWRELRDMLVVAHQGKCDRCGKDYSTDKYQLIAHHKEHLTDDNLKDPAIALNPDNIEILCAHCHALQHSERGYIQKRKQVFIVYGSPLSGKSTYVRDNMEVGDLVVDLDEIYKAISYQDKYIQPDQLKNTAFAVRDYLHDQIRIRSGKWTTAWVIAGLPRKADRERLAARLGASCILIEATQDECRRRLADCTDGRGYEWEQYIAQWFKDFTPS